MNLLKRWKKKKSLPPLPPLRDNMSSLQWRGQTELVTAARAILRSDEFRQMRQVVMEESPVKRVVLPYGAAKPSHMARVYAEERGFQLAIRMLEMLGEPYSKGEDLPVTFPDPLENNDLL